jgi:predicted DNA-binding transcriptional regulator YafY
MARNEQLIRQHKLLQILERYRFGRTLAEVRDELVEELGLTSLHERSVRRDIEALQGAGFDIVSTSVQRGRVWKLGPGVHTTHAIAASATELLALSLGRQLLTPLYGTPFWSGIETFWNKMREALPASVWQHFERARGALVVRGLASKSYARQQGMLKTLHRAILEHRVVEIDYRPPGKVQQTRCIEPYAVLVYQASLYIAAADPEAAGEIAARLRHFKLDRFQRATLRDQWFQPADDFQIEAHLGQGLGVFSPTQPQRYRIRLSPFAAAWVAEEPWHPRQELLWDSAGGAELRVTAGHELEILPRVLALAEHAELLEPLSARQALAELVKKMAAQYGPEGTDGGKERT